jgi:SWIM zinc finger
MLIFAISLDFFLLNIELVHYKKETIVSIQNEFNIIFYFCHMQWTDTTLRALAPDPETEKRGSQLARPDKWSSLGMIENAIWGLCQGSGSKPYQCVVDLNAPAYKCSCPSFKFPCKHSLGLMMLFVNQEKLFSETTPLDFAEAWLSKRSAAKDKEPSAKEEIVAPEESKLEKKAERLKLMSKGINLLEQWLNDWAMQGLAAAENFDMEDWEIAAARMVDAKIPGAAALIKEMRNAASESMQQEQNQMVEKAAELFLLIKSFRNIGKLPELIQEDLLQQLGISITKKELEVYPTVNDKWLVCGVIEGKSINDIPFRRTYLYGLQSKKYAVNLEFAPPFASSFEHTFIPKSILQAEVIYYPSNYPTRVYTKSYELTNEDFNISFFQSNIQEALNQFAAALQLNVWIREFPMALSSVTPVVIANQKLGLQDAFGNTIPIKTTDEEYWSILSKSGGNPMAVFGEWNGKWFVIVGFF